MRFLLPLALLLPACAAEAPAQETSTTMSVPISLERDPDPAVLDRFARLALDCVHREYPNKISRTVDTSAELGTPRELFPAFYGCFDWHSSVHGHWLLVRLLHVGDPEAPWREEAIAKLDRSFTPENLAGELANFNRPARGSWERPYLWAWYLQLATELREWDDPKAKEWLAVIQPLEAEIVAATKTWLPKLAYPIRLGTHNQSAFAMTLMHDWAVAAGDEEFKALIESRARDYHLDDADCPLAYEPSGEDFLSPCLMEADLMRRVLSPPDFARWLTDFLPQVPDTGGADWLVPGVVLDASDGKLVHLDGVNSSRAWNLRNIARALPDDDPRRASLAAAATEHEEVGVAAVSDKHYSGSHWLASFATYLLTDRGWNE